MWDQVNVQGGGNLAVLAELGGIRKPGSELSHATLQREECSRDAIALLQLHRLYGNGLRNNLLRGGADIVVDRRGERDM